MKVIIRPTGEIFRLLFDSILVVALVLAIVASAKAQVISLTNPATAPAGGYAPGATIPLSITKTGNPNVTGVQFDLTAGAGASVAVTPGAALPPSKTLTCFPVVPSGVVTCLAVGLNIDDIPDGTLAVATVQLAPAAIGSSPIVVTILNVVATDAAGTALPATIGNPTVSLLLRSSCDVNGDGSVGSADLSAVVSVAIQKGTNTATDLNKDGKTNVQDAQIVGTAATAPAFTCLAH